MQSNLWILLVLAYGIIKGMREVLKKKALEKSTTIEVLFLYTFISFLLVTPEIRRAGGVPAGTMLFIAVKSFVIFVAWMAGFTAVRNMPVGLYGLLDQSRLVFSMLLGVIVLHETMGWAQVVGLVFVIAGLVMLRYIPGQRSADSGLQTGGQTGIQLPDRAGLQSAGQNRRQNGLQSAGQTRGNGASRLFVALTLLSALLNAVSGLFDKLLMSGGNVSDGQLQFWYMLFLTVYYALYILINRPGIDWKGALGNVWIWILAVLFVIADRFLFIANSYPESKVTVMTVLKQSCCVVTILGGRLVFKEKNLGYKLLCACIVIAGILITVIR